MNYKKTCCFLTAMLWLGLLAACTSAASSEQPTAVSLPHTLDGTEWSVVSLNGRSPLPESRLTLLFSGGEVTGYSGCNWYGGAYTATAQGSLTIPEVASTARDCPEIEGVLAQETAFQEALWMAAGYRFQGDQLAIHNAAGETTLVFEPKAQFDMNPVDLVGTAWQLSAWDSQELLPDTEITLIFDDAETISGFAGCRHYNGRYTAADDDIHFPMLSMAESNCNQAETVLIQEGNFTTALSEATNYQFGGRKAIPVYGSGRYFTI
ncbi:MAG: META domain-containing protein [Chloroflexota bacterium]